MYPERKPAMTEPEAVSTLPIAALTILDRMRLNNLFPNNFHEYSLRIDSDDLQMGVAIFPDPNQNPNLVITVEEKKDDKCIAVTTAEYHYNRDLSSLKFHDSEGFARTPTKDDIRRITTAADLLEIYEDDVEAIARKERVSSTQLLGRWIKSIFFF